MFTSIADAVIYLHNILQSEHTIPERMVNNMSDKEFSNTYDDGNIPDVDLPQDNVKNTVKNSNKSKNNLTSSHSESDIQEG